MVLLLVVIMIGLGAWQVGRAAAAALPVATVTEKPVTVAAGEEVSVDLPGYGAGAVTALGYDAETGLADPDADAEPMVEFGSDNARPIGSVAKVITALMIVDARPLDDDDGPSITLTERDVSYYQETLAEGGSNAPATAGTTISEREGLALMLIPSANNYSKTLAVWAYGSYDAFLSASREWLDERGLEDTVLADSSGLSEETVSTPADLLTVGRLLSEDDTLSKIVAMKKITVPGVGTVENTNQALGKKGIDGIKTGTTGRAGSCLLFSWHHTVAGKQVTMVGVFLDAPSHPTLDRDLLRLIPTFNDEFSTVRPVKEGATLGTAKAAWGQQVDLRAGRGITVRAWGPVEVQSDLETPAVNAMRRGQRVGHYDVVVNGEKKSVPVTSDGTISDPGLKWRVQHRDLLTY
ncbi:D-alanyl-D-alanine carboxypeptidase family protein [Microlunatus soli]|uniref:D-alanyl-D-alanine carboxypeptidase (Penicillin-binding protein 5/6) n=1 Tax=Microlunatus soli TaxID=630515 RepID=A0A1H1STC2_9ACTN|nr:D-alanyl-D-alanine carboxypeptidase [Microlunatus soli]SDS51224.1 D-alanyl-D-alanine carboxypeptidase (penicillin-binding protein 5/6) [Microlunatus soli]